MSEREREVAGFIAEGYTNRRIADELRLGIRTVESHRENIMKKLNIHSVAGLTRYAIAHGLTRID
jgi:DNA-binding NarL/FixJ family response regulator